MAQITWHHSVFEDYDFIGDYAADGKLVEKIHNKHPEWFEFINETICYYNYLVEPHKGFVPKILYVGPGQTSFKNQISLKNGKIVH